MIERLDQIKSEGFEALAGVKNAAEVEGLRVKLLGKKSELTLLLKSLGGMDPEERKEFGKVANKTRSFLQEEIDKAKTRLSKSELDNSLVSEAADITLPGVKRQVGRLHPISKMYTRFESLFLNLGFDIAEGPHIETVHYNFDALNTSPTHPTRDEQDTFYVSDDLVLRTHTSPVQVRTMESRKPPIRIIAPGKTFRRDEIDATHTPMFHQLEGLVIDKDITFGHLKGMLETIVKFIFGKNAKIRLRPSFFPFTEPSAEVDITCYVCKTEIRTDCRVCKGSGWVELWGCGMVHPGVIKMSGLDPEIYSGYAFGLGVDRITSALSGIVSPKYYFENDIEFLHQFLGREAL